MELEDGLLVPLRWMAWESVLEVNEHFFSDLETLFISNMKIIFLPFFYICHFRKENIRNFTKIPQI